jgi:hypothetical protein
MDQNRFINVVRSIVCASILGAGLVQTALAAPTNVTIAGSLQSEVGCAGDWQPDCAATHLTYDASDLVWQGSWTIPAGSYEYKAALNDSWSENYGLNAMPGGTNIPLNAPGTAVKFYYDDRSHWVTDNQNSRIVVAAGSFQSELGCPADWDPGCLRSWLEDLDGDGIYEFLTTALPQGNYDTKAAINESWGENYGQGGVADGANIPFYVPFNYAPMLFSFDSKTNLLTIGVETGAVPEPATLALLGVAFAGMGLARRRKLS